MKKIEWKFEEISKISNSEDVEEIDYNINGKEIKVYLNQVNMRLHDFFNGIPVFEILK